MHECTKLNEFVQKEITGMTHTKAYRESKLEIIARTNHKPKKEETMNDYCIKPDFSKYAEHYRTKYCGSICPERYDCNTAQQYIRR